MQQLAAASQDRVLSFPSSAVADTRVYDACRLSLDINGVKAAMSGVSYDTLQAAMTFLDQTLSCIGGSNLSPTDVDCNSNNTTQVTEDDIMEQYGQSLRHVAELRDHYTTTVCNVCEQLRSDVRTLKSSENCKGFDSAKMEQIMELLYTHKTQHEDLDEFLENTIICNYCFDKLRNSKDVARSLFNNMKKRQSALHS